MYAILSLLFLILSAVFALKAKIGVTDEKKLEDFKPTLATPFRTILVWAMVFGSFFLIFVDCKGIADTPFSIVFYGLCISVHFIFWYIFLAQFFLTNEEYNEVSDFTATFSRKNWKFLILSGIAVVASIMFYYKAF